MRFQCGFVYCYISFFVYCYIPSTPCNILDHMGLRNYRSRTTVEDLEEASGEGDREDGFEGAGCPELSKVEKWSARN